MDNKRLWIKGVEIRFIIDNGVMDDVTFYLQDPEPPVMFAPNVLTDDFIWVGSNTQLTHKHNQLQCNLDTFNKLSIVVEHINRLDDGELKKICSSREQCIAFYKRFYG